MVKSRSWVLCPRWTMLNYSRKKSMATAIQLCQWCWWHYDDDWFQMLLAESSCWRLFSLCWWFSQCIKSVTNILNRSPTSQICHQHIWSPISVTNIDATLSNFSWNFYTFQFHVMQHKIFEFLDFPNWTFQLLPDRLFHMFCK